MNPLYQLRQPRNPSQLWMTGDAECGFGTSDRGIHKKRRIPKPPSYSPPWRSVDSEKGKAREMERTQVLFIRFDVALHCYISVNSDKICDSGIVRKSLISHF